MRNPLQNKIKKIKTHRIYVDPKNCVLVISVALSDIFMFHLQRHEVTQHGFVKEQYEQGRERDTMGYFHC